MIPTSTSGSTPQPWCVIRKLPRMQRIVVARFQSRPEAEHYLRALRRMVPTATHEIVFEPAIAAPTPATSTLASAIPAIEDAALSWRPVSRWSSYSGGHLD